MRATIIVKGKVQGVGYRWFVRQSAKGIGIKCAARNLKDGSVEIFAEGEKDSINGIVSLLKNRKPPAASVDSIEVYEEGSNNYRGPFDNGADEVVV
ncbi:MAG: acylphosphatase [Candidatus Micrarchaeia archaeon]